jgi:hypothetical protein
MRFLLASILCCGYGLSLQGQEQQLAGTIRGELSRTIPLALPKPIEVAPSEGMSTNTNIAITPTTVPPIASITPPAPDIAQPKPEELEQPEQPILPPIEPPILEPKTPAIPLAQEEPVQEVAPAPTLPLPQEQRLPSVTPLPEPPPATHTLSEHEVEEATAETIDLDKEIVGFDTLGLDKPEGNWLIKRIWWEKAETRYEKIQNLIDQILDSRMIFFTQRNEIESKVLDPFYFQQSLTHGQLDEVITFLLDELKREHPKDRPVPPQEHQLYEKLLAEQRVLEQLKTDVDGIQKLDITLDDALTRLMEQINSCRSYEKRAWSAFKEIAKVLDHHKARDLYYSMDVFLSNIKSINSYIQNPFTQHFNSIINTIKENIERITQTLNSLKEKGIDLKQQVQNFEDQERALDCTLTTSQLESMKEKKHAQEEAEATPPQGWFGWIWSSITDFFSSLWNMIAFWR